MKKNPKYKQGIFNPLSQNKYNGSRPIYYRSSLELDVFRMLDRNKNIISWGSESIIIPYISPVDNKPHRYFVDLNFTLLINNIQKKFLVEIKPHAQTLQPVSSNRKASKTIIYENVMYKINQAKWAAAEAWCKKNNYKFLILTEKHIKT